jgi:hypothetical protein
LYPEGCLFFPITGPESKGGGNSSERYGINGVSRCCNVPLPDKLTLQIVLVTEICRSKTGYYAGNRIPGWNIIFIAGNPIRDHEV